MKDILLFLHKNFLIEALITLVISGILVVWLNLLIIESIIILFFIIFIFIVIISKLFLLIYKHFNRRT
ncbi:MAG: hypothetical protein ACD_33C00017G0002 [uncultured bacterium]|nr:MAG: hypothetical protein ACD_33C00017G0002 [uncultured bacterium]